MLGGAGYPRGWGTTLEYRIPEDSPVPLTCCVTQAVTHPLCASGSAPLLPGGRGQEVMWGPYHPVPRVFRCFPLQSLSQPARQKARLQGVLGNTPACTSCTSEGRSQGWNQICLAPRRRLGQLVPLLAAAGSESASRAAGSAAGSPRPGPAVTPDLPGQRPPHPAACG